MPPDSLARLIVLNGTVQLVGLVLLALITIRAHRELARISRAIAGLVIREEQNTRAETRAAGAHP